MITPLITPIWKWENAIDEDLLNKLELEISKMDQIQGELMHGSVDTILRNNTIVPLPGYHWFAGILYNFAIHANEAANWKRTLTRPEFLQIAHYGPNQFYDWHVDTNVLDPFNPFSRKITVVCLLNNETEFEGGELEIKALPDKTDLKRGTVIAFPSVLEHRVTPVTKGIRKSAALWALGPNNW